jgi:tetratricopeptide (TPR) repeat protein
VELNLALAYYKTGQLEQAATILEKVHKAVPDQLQPVLLLADCWLATGKNKNVVELLTPLADQKPNDLAIAYALGTALVRDNQTTRGQVVIERILRNGDSAEARLLMGTTKLSVRDYSGALADLAKAVELNPNLPDVHSFHGQALLSTGDSAEAAVAFRKALAANPNDFNANLQLAVLLKQDAKFEEAVKLLRRALQVRPADLAVRYQLASIDFNQGKIDTARAELESIVKEAPNFTEAHVTLATVYYRLKRKSDGDRERAIVDKLNAEAQAKEPGVKVK